MSLPPHAAANSQGRASGTSGSHLTESLTTGPRYGPQVPARSSSLGLSDSVNRNEPAQTLDSEIQEAADTLLQMKSSSSTGSGQPGGGKEVDAETAQSEDGSTMQSGFPWDPVRGSSPLSTHADIVDRQTLASQSDVPSSDQQGLMTRPPRVRACHSCRKHKKKCDHSRPCPNCSTRGIKCKP